MQNNTPTPPIIVNGIERNPRFWRECPCKNCGRIRVIRVKEIHNVKGRGSFCTRKCAGEWTTKTYNPTGIPYKGYRMAHENGKAIPEHRLVMSKHIGRALKAGERVAFKDGDKQNVSVENLVLLSPKSLVPQKPTRTEERRAEPETVDFL